MPFTPKRVGSVAYSLVMFGIVSVLAGVLIAGLFVPFAGLAGVSSKAAAAELDNLPAELATPTPATRSKVLMANGKVLAYFYDENRIPVALKDVAPVMRQAQIAIEDHRFYEHGALDVKGTLRAFVRNSTSDIGTQGGSSITQQYVKMVQIEACEAKADNACAAAAIAPTMQRKIRELRYAIALEKRLTKDEILERYLNIAYYGGGAYGVQAAAKHYFSTTAAKLTLPQAAMLAGLVQNPTAYDPVRNSLAAIDRRDVVLNRMNELGLITPAQLKAAKAVKFHQNKVKAVLKGCQETKFPFLCEYVRTTLLSMPSLGKTVAQRTAMINRGGLTIQTAIDPKTQLIAQKAVSRIVGPKDPLISTMNMIQPGTGLILAMAQSRPVMGPSKKKGQTYFNYNVPYAQGGAEGYQAGSTFKVFTAAAALEQGVPLSKKFNAKSPMDFSNVKFKTCHEGLIHSPGYKPKNSTVSGRMDMSRGMAQSVNTYFLQLEHTTGICAASKMAARLGAVESQPKKSGYNLTNDPEVQVPSFTLGIANVAPLSMVEAYATFAARGIHCDPIILDKVLSRTGKSLDVPSANCERVLSKPVADGVTKLLTGVMTNGTGSAIRLPGIKNQAGKTGTIEQNRSVWFNGFTPEVAGAAMIAVDPTVKPWKGHPGRGLKGYFIKSSKYNLQGHGSTDAGNFIWRPAMTAAMKGKPDISFHQPPASILHGKKVTVPGDLYSMSIADAAKKLNKLGFTVEKKMVASDRPKYSFVGWSPGPGYQVTKFDTIYELFSSGKHKKKDKKKDKKIVAQAGRPGG